MRNHNYPGQNQQLFLGGMPRPSPLHQIIEQSIQADDINELVKPETIVWAKLRGYPWWPGRVKGQESCPRELIQIAKTQYRPGTVVAVYFFGSHDFSLVPVESLRPFEPNWELFCSRSSSSRFNQALVEARDPERYRHFEMASSIIPTTHMESSTSGVPAAAAVKRKRGRPPRNQTLSGASNQDSKRLCLNKRPKRVDTYGMATEDHILYCRTKLQKILLREQLKDIEIPVSERIMVALKDYAVSIDTIKNTKIGLVLRKASRREEFSLDGTFPAIGVQIVDILKGWRPLLDRFIREVGL